ncbi:hypothetical protein H4R33_006833 [Dimargaris cristalligena]|nr:hypothetical protein H4R33_006833 [Dimargaris cristalligena]
MITTNFYLPRLPYSVGLRTPNSTVKTLSFMSISRMIISGAVAQGQLPDYSPSPSNSDITPTQPPRVIYRVDRRTFDPPTPIITPSHLDLPGTELRFAPVSFGTITSDTYCSTAYPSPCRVLRGGT